MNTLKERVALGALDKKQIIVCQPDTNVAGKPTGSILYIQSDGRYAIGRPEDADCLREAGYVVDNRYV